jgi:hypothetical protein
VINGGEIPPGGALPLQTITFTVLEDHHFNCTNTCGSTPEHESMANGLIHVVP